MHGTFGRTSLQAAGDQSGAVIMGIGSCRGVRVDHVGPSAHGAALPLAGAQGVSDGEHRLDGAVTLCAVERRGPMGRQTLITPGG